MFTAWSMSRFVFPARAGMIPTMSYVRPGSSGIPRESGDDPAVPFTAASALEYSPRERG